MTGDGGQLTKNPGGDNGNKQPDLMIQTAGDRFMLIAQAGLGV